MEQHADRESQETAGQKTAEKTQKKTGASGLGLAGRISTELVAAVLVGALIGLWLDKVFDTRPWLLLVFLFLGFAAALRNIIRVADQAERVAKQNKQLTKTER